jgi:hypothetical protein
MLADYYVLANLIERHGTPRIVVPNTAICQYTKQGSGSIFVGNTPPGGMNPLDARVVHCRIPFGNEPFLQIRAYIEVEASAFASARATLYDMGVIELLRGGTLYGPRGRAKPVTRVAVHEDATPLGAPQFHKAVAQRRVLAIHAERFMGDASLRLNIAAAPVLKGSGELCLLFDAPCRLTETELSFDPAEGSLESTAEVIDQFRQQLTRPLPR